MGLMIRSEDLQGMITIDEAIAAVREGFRDQGELPSYSAPRLRILHGDRRVSIHPGGCHNLQVCGMFIHVERFTFTGGAQQYAGAGKRVYVAYDTETAALKAIIVGSLPLFEFDPPEDWYGTETAITGAVGTEILAFPPEISTRVRGLNQLVYAASPPSARNSPRTRTHWALICGSSFGDAIPDPINRFDYIYRKTFQPSGAKLLVAKRSEASVHFVFFRCDRTSHPGGTSFYVFGNRIRPTDPFHKLFGRSNPSFGIQQSAPWLLLWRGRETSRRCRILNAEN